jgi:hypothetical protein
MTGAHEPSDPRYHEQEFGQFTRPDTQSIHTAAQRGNVADDSFKNVAHEHVDLQQQPPFFGDVIARLRTNSRSFVGSAAFNSATGYTDRPEGAPGCTVDTQRYDLRSDAGTFGGMMPAGHRPAQHDNYHSAGTGSSGNGTHHSGADGASQARAATTARPGMSYANPARDDGAFKNMSPLQIMQAAMRGEL